MAPRTSVKPENGMASPAPPAELLPAASGRSAAATADDAQPGPETSGGDPPEGHDRTEEIPALIGADAQGTADEETTSAAAVQDVTPEPPSPAPTRPDAGNDGEVERPPARDEAPDDPAEPVSGTTAEALPKADQDAGDDTAALCALAEELCSDGADAGWEHVASLLSEEPLLKQPVDGAEVRTILESLHTSLQSARSEIDTIAACTDGLVAQVTAISGKCDLLAEEVEAIPADIGAERFLSKSFLTIASLVVIALAGFQVYLFTSLLKVQRQQNSAGASILAAVGGLDRKLARYDANLARALADADRQERHIDAAAGGHDPHAAKEGEGAVPVMPVREKLNRLRSGQTEKRLIRKETGDWFVYAKKSEECIVDLDVIDALNQAYRRSGRSLTPRTPVPPHKAVCILKPDGKGGTDIVMTSEFAQ